MLRIYCVAADLHISGYADSDFVSVIGGNGCLDAKLKKITVCVYDEFPAQVTEMKGKWLNYD
uniref:Uncharacterized protein n=1 Tax=Rhizophora mucronata TaxID=61149 RepID=A0A2P2NWC1_RHIMU